MQNIDKTSGSILAQSLRGLSPMTPFKDAPDKFQWRWLNLDNPKIAKELPADVNKDIAKLPQLIQVAKDGNDSEIMRLIDKGMMFTNHYEFMDNGLCGKFWREIVFLMKRRDIG